MLNLLGKTAMLSPHTVIFLKWLSGENIERYTADKHFATGFIHIHHTGAMNGVKDNILFRSE